MFVELLIPGFGMILLGIMHFRYIAKHGKCFLLSDVCLWTTAFSVGGSPIITYIARGDSLSGWHDLIWSYIAFYLYMLGLAFSRLPFRKSLAPMSAMVGQGWRSPVFFITKNVQNIPHNNILACFMVLIMLKLYAFSKGGGMSGLETLEVNLEKNYLMVAIEFIASPFLVAVSFYSIDSLLRKANRKPAIIMLSSILLFVLLMGRRSIIYFGVLVGMTVFSFYGRITARQLIFGITFVIMVFSVFSPFYLSFRLAAQSQSLYGGNTLNIIYVAVSDMFDVDQYERNKISEQNIKERALGLLGWMREIEAAVQLHGPLLGAAFLQGQMAGLPRILRGEQIALNPKIYVQQQLGLQQGDATYSQAAQGVADFGILGGLLAGFSMGVFINYGVVVAIKFFHRLPLFGLSIFSAMFTIAIDPEVNPGFELNVIRNFAILGLILLLLRKAGIRMMNANSFRT